MKKYNDFLWWEIEGGNNLRIYFNKYETLFGLSKKELNGYPIVGHLFKCPIKSRGYRNILKEITYIQSSNQSDIKQFDWYISFNINTNKIKRYRLKKEEIIETLLNNISIYNKNTKNMYRYIPVHILRKKFSQFKILNYFEWTNDDGVNILRLTLLNMMHNIVVIDYNSFDESITTIK